MDSYQLRVPRCESFLETGNWKLVTLKKEVKQMALDWKPRHRDMIIGGIPWLARISDKANAQLQGIIGEYIYP